MSGPASSSPPIVSPMPNAGNAPPQVPNIPNATLGSDDSLGALASSTAAYLAGTESPREHGVSDNNNTKPSPTFNQTLTFAGSRSDSRSSEHSAEDIHLLTKPEDRMSHLMRKKVERTSIHIISFLRLHVRLPASFSPAGSAPITFAVTVDASRTIEYLAALIEAEYAFRYTTLAEQCRVPPPCPGGNKSGVQTPTTAGASGAQDPQAEPHGERDLRRGPLVVGLLCDAGGREFHFRDVIASVLNLGDLVVVVEGMDSSDVTELVPANATSATHGGGIYNSKNPLLASNFDLYTPTDSNLGALAATKLPTSKDQLEDTGDNRFLGLLRNHAGLSLFREFCTTELSLEALLFWIEVEIFTSTSPELRWLMGKYVYFMYIDEHAPLVINIPAEMRAEIEHAVEVQRDLRTFDEAQLHVYCILKKQVFPKFEKADKFKEFLRFRSSNPQAYFAAKIRGPFAHHFKPNLELMLEINGGAAFTMRGARPPIYIKEKFLNRVVKCYFPASTAVEGYWSQVSQAAALQRVRKVQKEKKLSKFFGVDESKDKRDQLKDQMHRQFTPIVSKAEDLTVASARSTSSLHHLSQDDLLAVPIYSDGGMSSGSEAASPTGGAATGTVAVGSAPLGASTGGIGDDDLYSRKKRADKLADFFGKKVDMGDNGLDSQADLPLPESATMTIPRPRGISASSNVGGPMAGFGTLAGHGGAGVGKYGKGDLGKDDGSHFAQLPVATLNELPSETKAILTRRSKKLRHVLGEALDENTAYDALLRDVFNSNTPLDRRLSAAVVRPAPAAGVAPSSSYQGGLASMEGSDEEFVDADPFLEDDMSFAESDLLNSSDDDDADDGSSLMSRERPVDPSAAKLRKVQRRGKLQQILGEGKLPTSVGNAQQAGSAPGAALRAQSVRRAPATKEERREQRKRVTKLEKVFGQLPPTEALTETQRRTYEHRKSILSISRVLTDTKALANVLEHLATTVQPDQVPGAIPENQEVSMSPTDVSAMAVPSGFGSHSASARMAKSGSSPSLMSAGISLTSSDTESTDGEASVRKDKVRRKQKFNKLAKFFGGQLDPTLLIEQNIIGKLEREIEKDMAGDESSMTILRQDLAALREQVKEVARDLVSEHESAGEGDSDTGGSSTAAPRSRSKSGRRTQRQSPTAGHGSGQTAAVGAAQSGDEAEDEFEDASSAATVLGGTDATGKAGRRTSIKSGRAVSQERRSVTSAASDHTSEIGGGAADSTQSSSRLLGSQP